MIILEPCLAWIENGQVHEKNMWDQSLSHQQIEDVAIGNKQLKAGQKRKILREIYKWLESDANDINIFECKCVKWLENAQTTTMIRFFAQ